jgi:hypothetical protein
VHSDLFFALLFAFVIKISFFTLFTAHYLKQQSLETGSVSVFRCVEGAPTMSQSLESPVIQASSS